MSCQRARLKDFKCDHDPTHRVCAQLLNGEGHPLDWGVPGLRRFKGLSLVLALIGLDHVPTFLPDLAQTLRPRETSGKSQGSRPELDAVVVANQLLATGQRGRVGDETYEFGFLFYL